MLFCAKCMNSSITILGSSHSQHRIDMDISFRHKAGLDMMSIVNYVYYEILSFENFYGRQHDLVDHYQLSVTSMMTDIFVI